MAENGSFWDVAIIGAGPAGSLLSLILARRGLSVILLDQADFPRRKVCGGCLNGSAMAALAHCELADLPARLGAQPVKRVHLRCQDHSAELPFKNHWSISRASFDAALVQEAQAAGVRFAPDNRASIGAIKDDYRQVEVQTSSGHTVLHAKVVIKAHGLKEGVVSRKSRVGVGTILQQVPQRLHDDGLLMIIGRGGYVGGVRVEDKQYDVAAALDVDYLKARATVANAVDELFRQAGFEIGNELAEAAWKGTPLLTRQPKQIAGERWFAVGDAAGYVEPFTGEGMAWAMNGAIALAPIVQRCVTQVHSCAAKEWTAVYRQKIGRKQWPCRILAQLLRRPMLSSGLISGLQYFPGLARPVLQYFDRTTICPEGVTG